MKNIKAKAKAFWDRNSGKVALALTATTVAAVWVASNHYRNAQDAGAYAEIDTLTDPTSEDNDQ